MVKARGKQVVYFIEDEGNDQVKIGITNNVRKRIETLQCGHGAPLKLLGTLSGGRRIERQLHVRFNKYRIRNEWFRLSDEIREFIKDYTGDNGDKFELECADCLSEHTTATSKLCDKLGTSSVGRPKLPDGCARVPMNTFAARGYLQERLKFVAAARGDDTPNNLLEEAILLILQKYDRNWTVEQAKLRIEEARQNYDEIVAFYDKQSAEKLDNGHQFCMTYLTKQYRNKSVSAEDEFIKNELCPVIGVTFEQGCNILKYAKEEFNELLISLSDN